jgi:hypothetical protein
MKFKETKHPVPNQGIPPDYFLVALVEFGRSAPDELFEANPNRDIYVAIESTLGPWTDLQQRKAAGLEAMRVLGAEESDWDWNEGVDTTNRTSMTHLVGQETGIFQVSADSMELGSSLRAFIVGKLGSDDPQTFIDAMKKDHALAIEYAWRLLRVSTRWDGPINRGVLAKYLWKPAAEEFQSLLSQGAV